LEMKNRIPDIPVFVDSPLTVNVTEVFRLHTDLFDEDMAKTMEASGDPFQLRRIRYIRDVEQSMELNSMEEPAIIISAAGMCEFGRILHHLRNNCADERNTILIIGFQAKNTLGRRIVERQKEIKIFGIKHLLKAEVKTLNALSAHAGHSELVAFGRRFENRAQRILLVHGENGALESLQGALEAEGVQHVSIQEEGSPVEF
ncbi:MAG TPA: MBL fold metallo-hydrolase, partial [Candidatus Hydrogenedentes bacterium]|nr:MBL fold metallo-hydrolase [Candidatus Hydrogenedentota bacterium]